MSTRHGFRCFGLIAFAFVALTGCALQDEDEDPSANEASDDLRLGSITHARPEVGRILRNDDKLCTGTLVDPRVVLTASHCMSYRDNAAGGAVLGTFRIERWVNGVRRFYWYNYDGFNSFGTEPGSKDLALVHLTRAVPSTVATPLHIGTVAPPHGASVAVYGYGYHHCSVVKDVGVVNTGSLDGYKRRYSFAWGTPTNALCGGDSGGPVIYNGRVVAVNSGKNWNGTDLFAHVYDWDGALLQQVRAW